MRLCFMLLALFVATLSLPLLEAAGTIKLYKGTTISSSYYYSSKFTPISTDCFLQCLASTPCFQFSWVFPSTCLLFNTFQSYSFGLDTEISGEKISSGALSTPVSLGGPQVFYSPLKFYTYYYATFYNSGNKSLDLVWHAAQTGSGNYIDPVQLLKNTGTTCYAASFSSPFSFQVNQPPGDSGDGFAFYLSEDPSFANQQAGEYLGFPQYGATGIAIEFDTSQNVDLGDIDDTHVGVDVNFNATSVLAKSTIPLGIRLSSSSVKNAWVDYDGSTLVLSVYLAQGSTKPKIPLLQYAVNLCSLLRPTGCPDCARRNSFFFGFTGSNSGNLGSIGGNQRVTILSWSLSTTWPTKPAGTSPSGQCSIAPGLTFPNSNYANSFASSVAACCSKCSSDRHCFAFYWSSSSSICYLSWSPFEGQADSTYIGGYLPIGTYSYPLNYNVQTFTSSSPVFLYGSSTISDGSLVVTSGQSQTGYAFLSQPVEIMSNNGGVCSSYSLHVSFSFKIVGGDPNYGLGKGFTFFILGGEGRPQRMLSNGVADVGLNYNKASIDDPPGIVAFKFVVQNDSSVGDPPEPHVGITTVYGGFSQVTAIVQKYKLNLTDVVLKHSWIDFDSKTSVFSLSLGYSSTKPKSPILSYKVNLCSAFRSQSNTYDLLTAFLGFSGTTSYSSEIVEILSLSVQTSA